MITSMKMKTHIFFLVALISLTVLITLVAFRAKPAGPQEEPITFGAILILTDAGADYGANSRAGMELAVEEINSHGGLLGRQLVIDYQDNRGDSPKDAIAAFNHLKSRGVDVIVGTNWTPSGLAIAPLVDESTLLVSPSLGSREFAETHKHIFNMWPPDDVNTQALARHIWESGLEKVSVVGSLQEWDLEQAQIFRDEFSQLGGTVVSFDTPLPDNTELRTEALQIKEAHPDAIVMTNHGTMAVLSRRLRDIGVTAPFFSVNIWQPNIEASAGTFEGLVFSTPHDHSSDFVKKFENRLSRAPQIPAGTSYDTVKLLSEAIIETSSFDPSVLSKKLREYTTWSGTAGEYSFDESGSVSRTISFFTINNNKIAPLQKS